MSLVHRTLFASEWEMSGRRHDVAGVLSRNMVEPLWLPLVASLILSKSPSVPYEGILGSMRALWV